MAVNHYNVLLASEREVAEFLEYLAVPMHRISQIEFLKLQFFAGDILKAFKGLAVNKSPGLNGFTLGPS